MKRLSLNQSGFTLIEAMIALALLTIGIFSVMNMQTTSIYGNSQAANITTSNTAGNDLFERLLNTQYADALLTAGLHNSGEIAALALPPAVTSITWNVKIGTDSDGVDDDGDGNTDESDEVGIKFVTITVNYSDKAIAKTRLITFFKHEIL